MTTLLPYEERPDPGHRITELPGLCVLPVSSSTSEGAGPRLLG